MEAGIGLDRATVTAGGVDADDLQREGAQADALMALIAGSWTTQALGAAAELGLPDHLAAQPRTASELATLTGCDVDALQRLLRGLASLGIVRQQCDHHFALEPLGRLLRRDARPGLHAWAIWWSRHLWAPWGALADCVRSGRSAREQMTGRSGYAHIEGDAAAARVFNDAMAGMTAIVGRAVAAALALPAGGRIVDIGGGTGELLVALLQAFPQAEGVLVELAHARPAALARAQAAGLGDRLEVEVGDFFTAVPAGADVYLLKSVLHNWRDEQCARILAACRTALAPHARLMIIERLAPSQVAATPADQLLARSDLNMLVGLGGRERSLDEMKRLIAAAQLALDDVRPLALGYSMLQVRARHA